ncbi:MAG: hypothetical protein BWY09_02805 [Candidatus Hydrogenedentes bacterium ADurb.Bin179]|nr:MAG: hypothetical protein BWY09_02805 [Candidatus Hydrogenedentes bacterium ADurb.Bin179]
MALSLSSALALEINLYVDSAPADKSGLASWWAGAQNAAINNNFQNMANSYNSENKGTTYFELEDFLYVADYSQGKTLAFVAWIPGGKIEIEDNGKFIVKDRSSGESINYESHSATTIWGWQQSGTDPDTAAWSNVDDGAIALYAIGAAYPTYDGVLGDFENNRDQYTDVTFSISWTGGETSLTAIYNWPPRGVPEAGSTLGMAGFALMALGFLGRRLKS